MQRRDRDTCTAIKPTFEIYGAGAGHDVTHAVGEDRVREDRRSTGAIANDIAGLLRCLAKHPGSEIFLRVLEIELLGDGDAVIANDRRTPALLYQD